MHKGPRGTEAIESNHILAFGAQNSSAQGLSASEHITPTLDKSKTPAVSIHTAIKCSSGFKYHQGSSARGIGYQLEQSPTLDTSTTPAVAYDTTNITSPQNGSNPQPGDPCFTLAKGQRPPLLASMQVRRLTPTECERLQGFPDNYTQIPWRNKPAENCPDGPRYKAMGNSMAVPVMRWIGERIKLVDEL